MLPDPSPALHLLFTCSHAAWSISCPAFIVHLQSCSLIHLLPCIYCSLAVMQPDPYPALHLLFTCSHAAWSISCPAFIVHLQSCSLFHILPCLYCSCCLIHLLPCLHCLVTFLSDIGKFVERLWNVYSFTVLTLLVLVHTKLLKNTVPNTFSIHNFKIHKVQLFFSLGHECLFIVLTLSPTSPCAPPLSDGPRSDWT